MGLLSCGQLYSLRYGTLSRDFGMPRIEFMRRRVCTSFSLSSLSPSLLPLFLSFFFSIQHKSFFYPCWKHNIKFSISQHLSSCTLQARTHAQMCTHTYTHTHPHPSSYLLILSIRTRTDDGIMSLWVSNSCTEGLRGLEQEL